MAKKKTFEEEAKEQAKKYAASKNKLRLMKWLAGKEEGLQYIQNEVKEMLENCKKGDFSKLPGLTSEEEKTIIGDFKWTPSAMNNLVATGYSTNIASIADKVIAS